MLAVTSSKWPQREGGGVEAFGLSGTGCGAEFCALLLLLYVQYKTMAL